MNVVVIHHEYTTKLVLQLLHYTVFGELHVKKTKENFHRRIFQSVHQIFLCSF